MGKKNRNKKTAQKIEEVQEEIINDAENMGSITEENKGKIYTLKEFQELPKAGRVGGSREITTYTQINTKFPINKPVELVKVYMFLREITNVKETETALYKALWVSFYAKIKDPITGEMVTNNNKIGYKKAKTPTGEVLIAFFEK